MFVLAGHGKSGRRTAAERRKAFSIAGFCHGGRDKNRRWRTLFAVRRLSFDRTFHGLQVQTFGTEALGRIHGDQALTPRAFTLFRHGGTVPFLLISLMRPIGPMGDFWKLLKPLSNY